MLRTALSAPVVASTLHEASDLLSSRLRPVNAIVSSLENVDVLLFRDQAFAPGQPLLVTGGTDATDGSIDGKSGVGAGAIPAVRKWFKSETETKMDTHGYNQPYYTLRKQYLTPYKDTMLPFELILPSLKSLESQDSQHLNDFRRELAHHGLASYLPEMPKTPTGSEGIFHAFYAPLEVFLHATSRRTPLPETGISDGSGPWLRQLYIAQAKVTDLPPKLREDLPTPDVVKKVGKGDIYDANIWLGIPPTYTPLHRDPNPNLFVQLAGSKAVRMFEPQVGRAVFNAVQAKIGGYASPVFRGEEMMQGPERMALEEAVWKNPPEDGYEVVVKPGDALFIPKGWWHSIKSIGQDGVNGSVNWWFR